LKSIFVFLVYLLKYQLRIAGLYACTSIVNVNHVMRWGGVVIGCFMVDATNAWYSFWLEEDFGPRTVLWFLGWSGWLCVRRLAQHKACNTVAFMAAVRRLTRTWMRLLMLLSLKTLCTLTNFYGSGEGK
jgi:hypothetical protein